MRYIKNHPLTSKLNYRSLLGFSKRSIITIKWYLLEYSKRSFTFTKPYLFGLFRIMLMVLIVYLALLLYLNFLFYFCEPTIFCMDIFHEKDKIISKIATVTQNADYFKDQLVASELQLKDLIANKTQYSNQEFAHRLNEMQEVVSDSKTNYRSELRALQYYQNKLNTEDFNPPASSLGKRKSSDN